MNNIDWQEMGLKALMAFLSGFFVTIAATQVFDKSALIGALLAGTRALASAVVILLKAYTPVEVAGVKGKKSFSQRLINSL